MWIVALVALPLAVIAVLFRDKTTGSQAKSINTVNSANPGDPPHPGGPVPPSTQQFIVPGAAPSVSPELTPAPPKPRDLNPELTTPPDPKKLSNDR
jgi:hypothetical protein